MIGSGTLEQIKIAAVLFDLGDVIMMEQTEVKDSERNTLRADLVPGMGELLRDLKARGYRLGLVADTRPKTAWNVLHQHGLYELFDALAISEEIGAEKPDRRMFLAALDALGLSPDDYRNVLMVGNNLARDIRGANDVGITSVWFRWNERYPARLDNVTPDFEAHSARDLAELIASIDVRTPMRGPMDPSQLPQVEQNRSELELAGKYAPILLADEREPFSVVAAGYTIFEREGDSPSFTARRVEWQSAGIPAQRAIEYAIWWDWDIGHAYELEHVWTFVGAGGKVVAVEASWHGLYGIQEIDGHPPLLKTHPVLYAQPGKHAMAATLEPFAEIREWAEQEAGPEAGKDGVLEAKLFRGRLLKTTENDAKATAYLKKLAFKPCWKFGKRYPVTRPLLVPWSALEKWIPARVQWCLDQV